MQHSFLGIGQILTFYRRKGKIKREYEEKERFRMIYRRTKVGEKASTDNDSVL
jgi:hypothetical protein